MTDTSSKPPILAIPADSGTDSEARQNSGFATAIPWILQYWRVALRWKWVIAGTIIACLIAGAVYTMLAQRIYTATARVEISRTESKVLGNMTGVEPDRGGRIEQEFYQTQYNLLRARSQAERVARSLNLARDPTYLAAFGGKAPPSAMRVMSKAELDTATRRVAGNLLGSVQIKPIVGSALVDISVSTPDTELSAKIANSWAENFIAANLERRYDSASYARRFLEEQLAVTKAKMEEAERDLMGYAERQGILNIATSDSADPKAPTVERSITATDLVVLNDALNKATIDRIAAEGALKAASGQASATAAGSPGVSSLRQRKTELQAEYAKLMVIFQPDYPQAQALDRQIKEIDRAIAAEQGHFGGSTVATARAAYEAAVAREQELRARVAGTRTSLVDERRRGVQYGILQREVDTNRELYDGLLQRYKEVGIAGGVGTNNVAIVDRALKPGGPSSPRLISNMFTALLIGLALAGLLTIILAQIDTTVRDPAEAQEVTDLPLLGVIPDTDMELAIDEVRDRKSSQSEAYLSVQTALRFSTSQGVPRSLMCTSTRKGEGKSTSSYAIALSLHRIGRSAIVVDCDLRSPSVHRMAGVANGAGTSNFLSGNNDIQSLIHHDETDGLPFITAGPMPPNAAELLSSDRISELIEALAPHYRHIVIDAPPVLGLADSPLLGSKVDGVVYCVEAEGPRTNAIRYSLARLRNAGAALLGVVLTKFDEKRAYYGYGYEYGYGYADAQPGE
ncbi:MAG TPA: polysaccharide biosynthesis tyrosine autokinase [Sphingopyxis sp.]|nr:polysaccharide biosynthesis tyrosine autokinase [Sphingopyxis sp.]